MAALYRCLPHYATLPAETHPGLVARRVDPIAPNFAALRRVSSNAERA
jgi:hypothetical protein